MKQLLQLAPLVLCLAACQSNPTTSTITGVPAPEATTQEQAKAVPANPEFIELSMVTVNGKPQKELTIQQLESQLGRPDSIAKGAVECGGELATMNGPDGDFWYYGNTLYEVNGNRAMLASFDVTTGKFRGKLGKLVLNQNTTLEDVRRFYPVSAKQADAPSTGRPGEEMILPFYCKGEQVEGSLILVFKKGRLQVVDFFSPC